MAAKLSWLTTCKASQLKAFAVATGINSTGTKSILSSRLSDSLLKTDQLSNPPNVKQDGVLYNHRIISIDMGIRNLAYCRISLPSLWPSKASSPIIEAWERIAIGNIADTSIDDSAQPKPGESFDPLTYSLHAYTLIARLLSPLGSPNYRPPTQILIERQRFRSMGGSAVQEWTLRVNMFEAMLYAVLRTLEQQGIWKGTVWPITPNKVVNFWIGDETKAAERNGKAQKISMVDRLLNKGEYFALKEGALVTGRAWKAKKSKAKSNRTEKVNIGKLDDLADCLLQGLAWVRWEENKIKILNEGPQAMLRLD
ncbi:hypothetical protein MMC14_006200 [Varicellaria rhodocarpa]|nr:hypothetical protein [Varicellaria rhodocarpa]